MCPGSMTFHHGGHAMDHLRELTGFVGLGQDADKAALKEKPELAEKITRAVLEKAQVVGGTDVTGEKEDEKE